MRSGRLGTRHSWLGSSLRRFATVIGLGCATATALAQQPATGPRTGRAAALLPPQALGPNDIPQVARAAADDPFPASTPVIRSGSKANPVPPAGPAWLSGPSANLTPAAGIRPHLETPTPPGKAAPPPGQAASEPGLVSRGLDKLKGVTADRPVVQTAPPPAPPGRDSADAMTPFRGTGANGAPVYAGPPAYRWYGYGSVTPGANPFAPTGQYPRASANWYAITGATPGAFPVPVMNPARPAPGSEPPAYVGTPPPRNVASVSPSFNPGYAGPPGGMPPIADRPPAPPVPPVPTRPAPTLAPPGTSKFDPAGAGAEPPKFAPPPAPALPLPPVGVPTLAIPPVVLPDVAVVPPLPVKPPEPVGVIPPTIPPAPLAARPPAVPADIVPPAPIGVPESYVPSIAPPAGSSIAVSKPAGAPAARPGAMTDDIRWQQTNEPVQPLPGTWVPSGPRVRPATEVVLPPGAMANPRSEPIARGQAPDTGTRPDPTVALIQTMCRGRAAGVDVRWTGSKKLTVCFEVRGEPEAAKLVKDISARPELGPLQIDFCVLVK